MQISRVMLRPPAIKREIQLRPPAIELPALVACRTWVGETTAGRSILKRQTVVAQQGGWRMMAKERTVLVRLGKIKDAVKESGLRKRNLFTELLPVGAVRLGDCAALIDIWRMV